jgi:anti-sigma B factor antagonist
MAMKIKQLKNLTVLYPEENLIGEAVEDLNKELEAFLNKKELKFFLINLKNVSQIDSYALSILATFGNEIKPKGGILVFSNLQPFIFSIFRMMRMDDIFEIFEEEEQAVSKFNE